MSENGSREPVGARSAGAHLRRPPLLARVYLRLLTLRARSRMLVEATFDGLWLGLLDHDSLAAIDEAYYESAVEAVSGEQARYHDRSHITQGLHPWERAMTTRFPPGARVVVTSAGAGREVLALTDLGFDVVGFEPNSHLVEAGRRVLADPSSLRPSRRDEFPAAAGPAEVVIIGWGSYMLVKGRTARTALLRGAASAIPAGGLVLVSFFVRPPVRYFSVAHSVARASSSGDPTAAAARRLSSATGCRPTTCTTSPVRRSSVRLRPSACTWSSTTHSRTDTHSSLAPGEFIRSFKPELISQASRSSHGLPPCSGLAGSLAYPSVRTAVRLWLGVNYSPWEV